MILVCCVIVSSVSVLETRFWRIYITQVIGFLIPFGDC